MQSLGQTAGVLSDFFLDQTADGRGRINGDTVAGMDAGALNMLHNAGDQNVRAVTNCIHLNLLALQVLIHQNRVILGNAVDDFHELFDFLIGQGNLHALAAQNIGGAHQYRIA